MKRILRLLIILVLVSAALICWLFFTSTTSFEGKSNYFIVSSKDKTAILDEMKSKGIISNKSVFSFLAARTGVWDKIKTGKYEVKKGSNMVDIARMLKNGKQAEIKLVINRLRTREDLARLIGKNFSADSTTVMQYISSNDSLKQYGVDTTSLFTMMLPNTYIFYWNDPLERIFRKLAATKTTFWGAKERQKKAEDIGLTPEQVYTLASIVEEETNYEPDKYKIASVYLNRLNIRMPLQACPTIKYAMKDFTLTRIYEKYLFNPSPYNTYRKAGLPPGPICTPASKTIDIILDAPKTDYLYFVAKSDFSGYHHFSSSYDEHSLYARDYQKKLDEYMARKKEKANQ